MYSVWSALFSVRYSLIKITSILLLLGTQSSCASCEVETPELAGMEVVDLLFKRGTETIRTQVRLADEGGERAAGFQHICAITIDTTLIYFAFERVRAPNFHMRNVKAALDIAFITEDGNIAEIQQMQPYVLGSNKETYYSPHQPVAAALEARSRIFCRAWYICGMASTDRKVVTDSSSSAPVVRYGFWDSLFDIAALFEKSSTPLFPKGLAGKIYWLESRPEEKGRTVLVCKDSNGKEISLTPPGFSIRSHVHEYGGCAYALGTHHCYFVNDKDQRIYRQSLDQDSEPRPVTVESSTHVQRYIDLQISSQEDFLVCVMETEIQGEENTNQLVAISLNQELPAIAKVIASGSDFYANPVLDSNATQMAWFQWQHPNMPWDQSELMIAGIKHEEIECVLVDPHSLINEPGVSVCQLAFNGNDQLIFAKDQDSETDVENFWNLFCYDGNQIKSLTTDQQEYGWPHWIFGDNRYVCLGENILAARTDGTADELVIVDNAADKVDSVSAASVSLSQMGSDGSGGAVFVESGYTYSPQLSSYSAGQIRVVKSNNELIEAKAVSIPKPIRYPTSFNQESHAYFYSPKNPGFAPVAGELPPLLVMVHGGPTARSGSGLDLTRQYWTGLGFAVLDVNHRGSTGYGRRYRQSLIGYWGEYDTDDVVYGIRYVVEQGWVDPRQVFIRGKSAGGYAVMCALTQYPEYFAGGACYYGIGNLLTLAQTTHKFEARYTDKLVGETYDPATANQIQSRFYKRSPIHRVSNISCPLIVFQGLQDKVVPPSVAQEIVSSLETQNIPYQYVEYPEEGHGFRNSETNIDALNKETRFYQSILSGDSVNESD